MAWEMTRTVGYNLNTHGVNEPVLRRQALDNRFMPRRPKGIRQPGTDYIHLLEARTPIKGTGDPRVYGNRTQYQKNNMTITG
jgi:hypothetical protein